MPMIGLIPYKQKVVMVLLIMLSGLMDIKFDGIMAIHLGTNCKMASVQLYRIIKDPEYMMVLQYFKGGSLRNNLNNNFQLE
ncbi:hypothetical protein Glove_374g39 [Diversispora epigaea]|uniref:Protein kinase domain-containing protein n=1 Tax=Diversispora epigaea TaxID=1348612 RepID=A0A397H8P4_9GLOM|nr:hypothetical protein Glove_374g39 [Diversispora epigaea]